MTHLNQQMKRLLGTALIALALPVAVAAADFDHSTFNRLLSQSVANGLIDYSTFKSSADFTAYLAALEGANLKSLTPDQQLAFWINGYNALVIKNVLDNPGMKKPTDVAGFFDRKKFKIAGKSFTLNEIENDAIRKVFKEPLIHFGLVCAAKSCPPILPQAYTAGNVRAMLAANARKYLASGQNRYDAKRGELQLSKIFEWYRDDFGGENGLREFVKKYGTPAMRKAITEHPNIRIVSLEYDWTINKR